MRCRAAPSLPSLPPPPPLLLPPLPPLLLLLLLLPASRSVDVPGWARDPIPGASAGSESALLQVYEEVLSVPLLKALEAEAPFLAQFAKTFGNLKNSKYTTFWKPTGDGAPAARTASEHAVDVMFDILFGDGVMAAGGDASNGNGDADHRARVSYRGVFGGVFRRSVSEECFGGVFRSVSEEFGVFGGLYLVVRPPSRPRCSALWFLLTYPARANPFPVARFLFLIVLLLGSFPVWCFSCWLFLLFLFFSLFFTPFSSPNTSLPFSVRFVVCFFFFFFFFLLFFFFFLLFFFFFFFFSLLLLPSSSPFFFFFHFFVFLLPSSSSSSSSSSAVGTQPPRCAPRSSGASTGTSIAAPATASGSTTTRTKGWRRTR